MLGDSPLYYAAGARTAAGHPDASASPSISGSIAER
jgi:hypothetical protein